MPPVIFLNLIMERRDIQEENRGARKFRSPLEKRLNQNRTLERCWTKSKTKAHKARRRIKQEKV